MHKWRWLYIKSHQLHHLTYCSQGITAHYMHWIDFFLESTIEGITHVLCFPLGGSPIGFISFTCAGVFNGVVVHSGWNFKFLPDPVRHYFHHSKFSVNYSIGPLDFLLGTSDNGAQN